MNSALLLKAMSDINDEYIEAAITEPSSPPVARTKKRGAFRQRYIAVACAVAALFAVILVPTIVIGVNNIGQLTLPPVTDNVPPPDDKLNPAGYYELHGTAKNKYGSVTFAEYADYKITLELSIVDEAFWGNGSVAVYGHSFLPCVNSSGGDEDDATAYCTTNYGQPTESDGSIFLPDALSVEVDGVYSPDKSLPQKAGTYRIVLDFSAMMFVDESIRMEEFTVGEFCFDLSGLQ